MADDPYSVLGVAKTASQGDIKKAYRKLAKELHPDLNPGDKTAEERFKKISAAYHLLDDPDLRARYDRGEIDASGAERPEQAFYRHYAETEGGERYHSAAGYQDFADMSDVFADLFGGRGQGGGRRGLRGQDLRYRLEVAFLDAAKGAKRRVTMPDGKALDLSIPAGTRDGGILRLKGQGGAGIGGEPPGDALVEIAVKPHAHFKREADDILLDLPITIDEAVLGGKVEVPTLGGRVKMTLPKGTSSGQVLRLKGKGIAAAGRPAGDLRVTIKVVMPKEIDQDLESFMQKWRAEHAYDPRTVFGAEA